MKTPISTLTTFLLFVGFSTASAQTVNRSSLTRSISMDFLGPVSAPDQTSSWSDSIDFGDFSVSMDSDVQALSMSVDAEADGPDGSTVYIDDFTVDSIMAIDISGYASASQTLPVSSSLELAYASVRLFENGSQVWALFAQDSYGGSSSSLSQGSFNYTLLPGNSYRVSSSATTPLLGVASSQASYSFTAVPEPSSVLLSCIAAGAALVRRQRRA